MCAILTAGHPSIPSAVLAPPPPLENLWPIVERTTAGHGTRGTTRPARTFIPFCAPEDDASLAALAAKPWQSPAEGPAEKAVRPSARQVERQCRQCRQCAGMAHRPIGLPPRAPRQAARDPCERERDNETGETDGPTVREKLHSHTERAEMVSQRSPSCVSPTSWTPWTPWTPWSDSCLASPLPKPFSYW